MRFPETRLMQPTFDLFKYLNLPLQTYHISGKRTWVAYNSKRYRQEDLEVNNYSDDPFGVGCANGGTVPDRFARMNPSKLLHDAIYEDFIKVFLEDRLKGIEKITAHDKYSTRSYLMLEKGFDASTVDYMETMCFGTGWFDRALA